MPSCQGIMVEMLDILIVPKRKISSLDKAKDSDFETLGQMCKVAACLIRQLNIENYRLITNGGRYQKFKYLHLHLVSNQ